MSDKSLKNRIEKLKKLEAEKKAVEKQIEVVQLEIKNELKIRGTDEATAGDWIVRFKDIVSNRFNVKGFAADHPKLYQKYMVQAQSMRFTIS